MSLRVVRLASEIENSDYFHMARLLLLLSASSGRKNKPIDGIMKLAKMDFLLRYPNCLVRILNALGRTNAADQIGEEERNTIESRMIRFRFGPWDKRYRRWIGMLVSKRLANTFVQGKTVKVQLTDRGSRVASELAEKKEFKELKKRSRLIATTVGKYSGSKLKDFIYEVFPEIVEMRWGRGIKI